MKKSMKALSLLMVLVTMLTLFSQTAFALDWDGESADTGSGGRPADVNGYALRLYPGDNCIGYRFSCVDKDGSNKVSKVIDVFRNTQYGNYAYGSDYKFTTKYNKKQLIANQYGSFSTARTSNNCYKETELGFATSLGAPDTMGAWQNIEKNLNVILSVLGLGTIDDLNGGDKVLVEPIYDIKIQTIYHALTTTEAAVYGAAILGMDSDGGASSTASTWGFISVGPNRVYPNHLFTPDGQGLWPGATLLTNRATFRTIINTGYGVGIAYTCEKDDFEPQLNVKEVYSYKGTAYSKTFRYGTSTGNSFALFNYDKGYPAYGDSIFFTVYFPDETRNIYVRQTVWIDGVQVGTRTGNSSYSTLFDVKTSNVVIPNDKSYYSVQARVDWINTSGSTLKYGVMKTFYVPVKPTVYRYSVTAINVRNTEQARSGLGGSSGKVYAGQKIYTKYQYTTDNTWGSYNNLTAVPNTVSSAKDVSRDGVLLAKNSPSTQTSSLWFVYVPNVTQLKYTMTSAWRSDPARTLQTSTYTIPVIKADVELADIYLTDTNGVVLDPYNLEADTTAKVYYVYKNNTDIDVQVDGFRNDQTKINADGTFYNIPANGRITVFGGSITVPNLETFSIWGGVYLYGAGRGNTSYESNGSNNTMMLGCKTVCPLSLIPITPNADYREDTEVISSFWLRNGSSRIFTQTNNVTAEFTVKKANGSTVTTVSRAQLVVPGKDQNLVYFKWKVPAGLNNGKITITAVLKVNGTENYRVSKQYSTVPYTVYSTPDTQYERSAPSGFTVPVTPSDNTQYGTWWEYVYTGGKFVKKEYCVTAPSTKASIQAATGETDYVTQSDQIVMKSGYGISIGAGLSVVNASGYDTATSAMFTQPQFVTATFPEFEFRQAANKCRTLQKTGHQWIFRPNGTYGNVHFTPLYFPDGGYTVKVRYSDVWTPGGMITFTRSSNTVKIEGSAYDDWYIGR